MSAITSETGREFPSGIMSRVYPQDELVSLSPIPTYDVLRGIVDVAIAPGVVQAVVRSNPKTAVSNPAMDGCKVILFVAFLGTLVMISPP